MQKRILKMVTLIFCTGVLSLNVRAEIAYSDLLLVASQESKITSLSPLAIRKLFLGVPVFRNGQLLQPLLNASDPLLQQVFLQKVIFMSERSYEHELLSRIYRKGGTLPGKFSSNAELAKELQHLPDSLSYMWSGEFSKTSGIKSLGVIWTTTQ